MKLNYSSLWTLGIVPFVILMSATKCCFGEFPIPVGLFVKLFIVCALAGHVESGLRVGIFLKMIFFPDSETKDGDLIVKFKGEILSENLTELLRQDNITVPDERTALSAVL